MSSSSRQQKTKEQKMKGNVFSNQGNRGNVIVKKDGTFMRVRADRSRVFYPYEWEAFYQALKPKQQATFKILILLGCRVTEAFHIRPLDCDFERHIITLRHTKTRNADGTRKPRTIPISTQGSRWLKSLAKDVKPEDTFGFYNKNAANKAMKKALIKAGIADWRMFSVHNVRKTAETWLIALGVDSTRVSKHFGHSLAVANKHYIAPEAFGDDEKRHMRRILGDLYQPRNAY